MELCVIERKKKENPCFTLLFKSQHITISQLDPSMQCKKSAFEREIGQRKTLRSIHLCYSKEKIGTRLELYIK